VDVDLVVALADGGGGRGRLGDDGGERRRGRERGQQGEADDAACHACPPARACTACSRKFERRHCTARGVARQCPTSLKRIEDCTDAKGDTERMKSYPPIGPVK